MPLEKKVQKIRQKVESRKRKKVNYEADGYVAKRGDEWIGKTSPYQQDEQAKSQQDDREIEINCGGIIYKCSAVGGEKVAEVIGYYVEKIEAEITISKEISSNQGDYKVKSIADYAFKECTNLKTVRLLMGETGRKTGRIGQNAFEGCTALETIDLDNVGTIE